MPIPIYNISNLSRSSPILHGILFLMVINLLGLLFLGPVDSRYCRLLIGVVALVYFHFTFHYKRLWVYIVFISIIISDIGMLFYENSHAANIYRLGLCIAFVTLSISVVPKINWKEISKFEYITYTLLFLFSCFVFGFTVRNITDLFPDFLFTLSIYISGFIALITCLLYGFYQVVCTRFDNSFITIGVFCFAFSNYNLLVTYYYNIEPMLFYFLERILFVMALYGILRHVYETEQSILETGRKTKKSSQDSTGF